MNMAHRVSVTAEVVGVGSDGTEPSIVFAVHRHAVYSNDKTLLKRYLFNCGEGTQRICGENGIKLNSLDALFLTRLSIQTASGIPGLVFALGGLGAADLRIHGPQGTLSRLQAMRSFVRRKYPQIECVVVEPSQSEKTTDQGDISQRTWLDDTATEDRHARIVTVCLRRDKLHCETRCWICAKCSPLPTATHATATTSRPIAVDVDTVVDPDKAWLIRFYKAKGLHDKIPHTDAILRRYAGRIDELKRQFTAKYGDCDSDSSSSSSSSSDDDSSGEESTTQAFSATGPVNRQWLEAFYERYEPAKVARADQVLRQFAGREQQLRAMLLAKYSVDESEASEPPPLKKRKPNEEASECRPTVCETNDQEIPSVYTDEASDTPETSSESSGETICYVLQFCAVPSAVVWVIDCPTTDLIDSLVAQFRAVDCVHTPVLIVHFSPPSVLRNERHREWIASLAVDTQPEHLIFDGQSLQSTSGGVFSFVFQSSARHWLRQSASEPRETWPPRWKSLHQLLSSDEAGGTGFKQSKLLTQLGSTTAHVAQPKLAFLLQEKATDEYSATGWKPRPPKSEQQDEEKVEASQPIPPRPPHDHTKRTLAILGTGSAAPSKLRASTSMYLSLDASADGDSPHGMLIDCGEGTYGQLERQFNSPADLAARIAGLRCIWISHHHADHQCGLLRILDEYLRVTSADSAESKLFVVAPESVLGYIAAWVPVMPPRIQTATCDEMNDVSSTVRHEFKAWMSPYVDELRSVRVWHCFDSYGLVLKLSDGTKLVYSGDTKPCDQLVRAGYDASILIHEATFDDTMAEDAEKKKHSTVGQALDVARRMRAHRLVLTHFSQRYPSLPPALSVSESASSALQVISAYDGIVVEL